ncbi:hypothetical protein APHMUC_0226 [Anaplasma phagocytophilum str. ApMUC09]|uniref:Uncharacterized protein n=1 Tax=Anaplasma phagocytophilum str. ApMUC09 TaxID=1359152 RepID=A0A0F3N9R4_ANAPH|nr:hypothetical protein APHMUC_0226 [Anaplasma phagocytophilum str. ApMUC09]
MGNLLASIVTVAELILHDIEHVPEEEKSSIYTGLFKYIVISNLSE